MDGSSVPCGQAQRSAGALVLACLCWPLAFELLPCALMAAPPPKVSSELRTFSLQPLTFHLLNWHTDFTVFVNKVNRDLKSLEQELLTS